ncbi:hypothetical protein RA280_22810 [Cupriavidus sp. CV2]|uniref:hypothetical protein n=1 Tax=Cupriavidus ulmosensis TaxID=3065913 RepID=UPI00296B1186|nr:hypothetical protein [Cupriavidus sp. CV2]MDW3684525.1 hypothetical protein [Cupriavidus sp. CV2]
MQYDPIQLAQLGCILMAVLCTALAIRHTRKQTRVDHHISELERQLRERAPKRHDTTGEAHIFG